jgi:hypothetical protein
MIEAGGRFAKALVRLRPQTPDEMSVRREEFERRQMAKADAEVREVVAFARAVEEEKRRLRMIQDYEETTRETLLSVAHWNNITTNQLARLRRQHALNKSSSQMETIRRVRALLPLLIRHLEVQERPGGEGSGQGPEEPVRSLAIKLPGFVLPPASFVIPVERGRALAKAASRRPCVKESRLVNVAARGDADEEDGDKVVLQRHRVLPLGCRLMVLAGRRYIVDVSYFVDQHMLEFSAYDPLSSACSSLYLSVEGLPAVIGLLDLSKKSRGMLLDTFDQAKDAVLGLFGFNKDKKKKKGKKKQLKDGGTVDQVRAEPPTEGPCAVNLLTWTSPSCRVLMAQTPMRARGARPAAQARGAS